ncbi:953_t:CDS:2 [Racocetra persica]|uniref:953_t:CDS:1 n=1 Tax=Racocetra persica TaxID=160502 RepID=A0ACA9KD41_9GLOM|nr:953_t:CDS:2 [Racocetra persica]
MLDLIFFMYYKIVEIIEIEAGPSMIIATKSAFGILLISEILAKISSNLSLSDILSFLEFEETWLLNIVDSSIKEAAIKAIKEAVIKAIKEAIIKAIHSVDFYQLQGLYLSFDLQYSSLLSHVLFYFRKDAERFIKEFNQIPIDSVNNLLKEKVDIIYDCQKKILKARNPLINDDNMESILSRTRFFIPQEYILSDNLDSIFFNFA